MKPKSFIFGLLSVLTTLFIFYNSSLVASESSRNSGVIVTFILEKLACFGIDIDRHIMTVIVRKSAHTIEFFIQGLFMGLSYYFSKNYYPSKIINILFLGLLTAATDELIQGFVPGRGAMVSDIFIDYIGTILAICFVYVIFRLKRRSRRKE